MADQIPRNSRADENRAWLEEQLERRRWWAGWRAPLRVEGYPDANAHRVGDFTIGIFSHATPEQRARIEELIESSRRQPPQPWPLIGYEQMRPQGDDRWLPYTIRREENGQFMSRAPLAVFSMHDYNEIAEPLYHLTPRQRERFDRWADALGPFVEDESEE